MTNTAAQGKADNKVVASTKQTPKAEVKNALVETKKEKVTPGQITAALKAQMKEKKGVTYLSVTYSRYLFESMSIDELQAITNAIDEFVTLRRDAEIAVLEARLKMLKGSKTT